MLGDESYEWHTVLVAAVAVIAATGSNAHASKLIYVYVWDTL